VRRAVRLNDALPEDKAEHWVWQRGPWLLIDRATGKVTAPHLIDFDPAVSDVVWFRDYAAYCGLNASRKQLYGVVAQIAARRPLLARKLSAWDPSNHPLPACEPATWRGRRCALPFSRPERSRSASIWWASLRCWSRTATLRMRMGRIKINRKS